MGTTIDSRPVLDMTSMADALARPSCILHGRLYTGRLLSIDEWEIYQSRLMALGKLGRKQDVDADELSAGTKELANMYRSYCNALFSQPLWRFWKWGSNPTMKIMRSPPAVLGRIMADFFGCQERAMRIPRPRV